MVIEYVRLDPVTLEESESGQLYRKITLDDKVSFEAVSETKIETIRIDDNTVVDITYQFDINAGEYVETSRTNREEPLPPEPEDELTTIKLAMAEMAEAHEQEKTEIQIAIAELADIVAGGVE